MNKIIFGILFSCISMFCCTSDAETNSKNDRIGSINVKIDGFDNNNAQAMIALHNTKKTFLKKVEPFGRAIVPVNGSSLTYTFKDLPYGEYAVAVFQDDNKNEVLDMEKIIYPKEKYGFSNNVHSKFGPPGFDQAKFKLETKELEVDITLSKP